MGGASPLAPTKLTFLSVAGLGELPGRRLALPLDPRQRGLVGLGPVGGVEPDDLGERRVVERADPAEERPDRVLVPRLRDRQSVEAKLARSGIQVGPSSLVRQLMDSAK
jgi:hypothetical protein